MEIRKSHLIFPVSLLNHLADRLSCTRAKESHMAGAYFSFCSMKQLRVLLLSPEWDASPSQGYPQQYVTGTHLSFLSKETTRWQGLEPLTFRSEVQHANHYSTASSLYLTDNWFYFSDIGTFT